MTNEDENCPVCKSSRYLNPNIRFLMNSVCYHKMCESCVNRLFGSGPNNCPVIGCGHRLHARNFRAQFFSDVSVEREVDVRKRLTKVFNARAENFATLREWNDYLELVETYCFNLVNGVDVALTEAKIREYEAKEKESITTNAAQAAAEREARKTLADAEERVKTVAAQVAAAEAAAEKRDAAEVKKAQLDAIARGDTDEAALERIRADAERRATERRAKLREEERNARALRDQSDLMLRGVMRGEKVRRAGEAEDDEEEDLPPPVWTPTNGWEGRETRWWGALKRFEGSRLVQAEKDRHVQAGGWFVAEYAEYRLAEAFAGLTWFGDEQEGAGVAEVGDVMEGVGADGSEERALERTDVMIVDAVS